MVENEVTFMEFLLGRKMARIKGLDIVGDSPQKN
jgi:hypothetical protein